MRLFSLVRKLLTLIPLLFLLGSGLLLFFLLLSGASSSSSLLQKFYWLEADTQGLGSYSSTRWTDYRLCSAQGNQCGGSHAGLPISPEDNFGSSSSLPRDFITNRNKYYYESRIGWLFLLVSAFFVVLAILCSIPLLCLASSIVVTLSWLFTLIATIFIIVSALLYTHILTRAKRQFNNAGHSARVGRKMMAFIWTTVLLLLLSSLITFLLGCCQFGANRYDNHRRDKESALNGYYSDEDTYNDAYLSNPTDSRDLNDEKNANTKKSPFWKKNNRNVVSNANNYSNDGYTAAPIGGAGAGAAAASPAIGGGAAGTGNQESSKINFFRIRNNRDLTATAPQTTGALDSADEYARV